MREILNTPPTVISAASPKYLRRLPDAYIVEHLLRENLPSFD